MQKVKISVVSPDYNWVMCKCKVYWVFFILRGTKKLLDELLATNYWGGWVFRSCAPGVFEYTNDIFWGVPPRRGSDFVAIFVSWFPIREAGGFKDFLKFHPQKLGGTMRCDAMDMFQMGGKKNADPPMLIPKWSFVIFSQDALSWCEGNIQPTRS